MRTIETKLYKFDELSDKSKERAINARRESPHNELYAEDFYGTIKAFTKIFPVDVLRYDLLDRQSNRIRLTCTQEVAELSGIRLMSYLWNNYKNDVFKYKYLGHVSGFSKYSRVQLSDVCVLTGICYDHAILQPIYNAMNKPSSSTFAEILVGCIEEICIAAEKEWLYQNSNEYITEQLRENKTEFYENGDCY
jgi:hypothetical protein